MLHSGGFVRRKSLPIKSKPIEEYVRMFGKSFPAGIRVDILNSAIDFSKLDSGKINIVINKKVTGKSSSLNRFENNDTLFWNCLYPENRFYKENQYDWL